MIQRFLLCMFLCALAATAYSEQLNYNVTGENWSLGYGSEEGSGGTSYLGVDIADVSTERLGALKLKEEHGAEVTMVDQDAPAGKAGLQEHDVILSVNGAAIESAAQLRRMIKETPPGRTVTLGISRDGQPLSIKVQLADRHKSMAWPGSKFEMPQIPEMPSMPDFDVPVSVVIVHSSLRSGLMVENLTPQLGDFFGVKDGKGVLVRTVEKGSRGEKAGFRAGDVVVKVNNQPVHDTSDFTHALRSSSNTAATVTVMREKREQTLTLTLPEKKDSGTLIEDSFDLDDEDFTAETEQAINRAGDEIAYLTPAIVERAQREASRCQEREKETAKRQLERQKELQERKSELKDRQEALQERHKEAQERQRELREQQRKLRHELSGEWAEI
jgi:sulfur carrier protein ThiS